MVQVAFIGLGTMGLPMARHLLEAGHDVVGLDLEPQRARALGGRTADAVTAALHEYREAQATGLGALGHSAAYLVRSRTEQDV